MDHNPLITGATGDLGGNVINGLKQKTGVEIMAVLVRNEEKSVAQQFRQWVINVKVGDCANPAGLQSVFEGIGVLYFVLQ